MIKPEFALTDRFVSCENSNDWKTIKIRPDWPVIITTE